MAQPIIVAGATTESCAAVGPVRIHGEGPYSRMAGAVKRWWSTVAAKRGTKSELKSGDAAVQVVLVRALDFRGDDLADPQRTAA